MTRFGVLRDALRRLRLSALPLTGIAVALLLIQSQLAPIAAAACAVAGGGSIIYYLRRAFQQRNPASESQPRSSL